MSLYLFYCTVLHQAFQVLRQPKETQIRFRTNCASSRPENRIDEVQLTIVYLSMAATHNEQSHVVAWRTSLAETGDILQNTVSRDFRRVVIMIPKCANQAVFFVLIARRIL